MSSNQFANLITQRFVLLVLVIIIVGGLSFGELIDPARGVNIIIGILIGAGVLEGGNRVEARRG